MMVTWAVWFDFLKNEMSTLLACILCTEICNLTNGWIQISISICTCNLNKFSNISITYYIFMLLPSMVTITLGSFKISGSLSDVESDHICKPILTLSFMNEGSLFCKDTIGMVGKQNLLVGSASSN